MAPLAPATFSASLMCMDFSQAPAQLAVLNRRCDALHIDIMDGHFCPSMALTPTVMASLRPAVTRPMDAHLMTTGPERWLEPCAEAGARVVTLHRETIHTNAFRLLRRVRDLGCQAGLALCPATPLDVAHSLLEEIDLLTVMTVDIGYVGSPFLPAMLRKIEQARAFRDQHGLSFLIQVDGGCRLSTFARLRQAGAERFVLGSGLFTDSGPDFDLNRAFDTILADYKTATGEEPTC